jgi:hypothetical protein
MDNFKKIIEEWKDLESSVVGNLNKTNKFQENVTWEIPWNELMMCYSVFRGMDDDIYDKRLFSFWPLDKVITYSKRSEFDSSDLWPFADYGYEMNIYAIHKINLPNYGIYARCGDAVFRCSENLEDFFCTLQSDPEKLHIF